MVDNLLIAVHVLAYRILMSIYIYIYIYIFFAFFSHSFIWFFKLESEWQQVSSDLQDSSNCNDFSCAVVWIVLILLLIFSSPSLFPKFLWNVPSAPTMIGITVTFKFRNFFVSLEKLWYFPNFRFISLSLCYQLVLPNHLYDRFFFFLLIGNNSDFLALNGCSNCIQSSKNHSQRELL